MTTNQIEEGKYFLRPFTDHELGSVSVIPLDLATTVGNKVQHEGYAVCGDDNLGRFHACNHHSPQAISRVINKLLSIQISLNATIFPQRSLVLGV